MSAWKLMTGQWFTPTETDRYQAPSGSKPITEFLRWFVKAPFNHTGTTGRRIGRTSYRIPPQDNERQDDKKGV